MKNIYAYTKFSYVNVVVIPPVTLQLPISDMILGHLKIQMVSNEQRATCKIMLWKKWNIQEDINTCCYYWDDDVASVVVVSIICRADITLSRVSSGTAIPEVSMSATMAMAASNSPRSRQRVMISLYRGLQEQEGNINTIFSLMKLS